MGQSNCKILDCAAGCCNKAGICPIQPYSLGGSDKCEYYYNKTLAIYICIPLAFILLIVSIIAICCFFRNRINTKSNCSRDNKSTKSSDKNQENKSQKDEKQTNKAKEGFHVQRKDSSKEIIYDQGIINIQSEIALGAIAIGNKQNPSDELKDLAVQSEINQKIPIN